MRGRLKLLALYERIINLTVALHQLLQVVDNLILRRRKLECDADRFVPVRVICVPLKCKEAKLLSHTLEELVVAIERVAHDREIDTAQLRNTGACLILIEVLHELFFICVEKSVRLDVFNIVVVTNAHDSDALLVVIYHFLLSSEMNH